MTKDEIHVLRDIENRVNTLSAVVVRLGELIQAEDRENTPGLADDLAECERELRGLAWLDQKAKAAAGGE